MLPIVTEVAVIPGADAWLLVEPELLLLPLPHAATSTAATIRQVPVINRVELVCHTLISPPLCADTTDVPRAVDQAEHALARDERNTALRAHPFGGAVVDVPAGQGGDVDPDRGGLAVS